MSKKMKVLIIVVCCVIGLSIIGIIVCKTAFAKPAKDSSLAKSLKSSVLDSGNEKVVAKVNGISISKADVNYIMWVQKNSSDNNNKSMNETDAIKQSAKEKLLLSEAKSHNVSLTDDEIAKMRELLKSSVANNPEGNKDFISELGLSEDEVIDFTLQKQVDYTIENKYLTSVVMPLVLSKTYKTKNSELSEAITTYKSVDKDKFGNKQQQNILNLFEAYKNMLLSNAKLEII